MKHTARVTALLVSVFLATQALGLVLLNASIEVKTTPQGREVFHRETALGPRPEITGAETFVMIMVSVLIGTGIILLLIRLGRMDLWKFLYFFSVFFAISIALGVVLDPLTAMGAAFLLSVLKVFRPTNIIHNIIEVLVYPGFVIFFAPLIPIFWAAAILVAFSVYDIFAVWKSGHMVKMAKSLMETGVFAGFSMRYRKGRIKGAETTEEGEAEAHAILGGGDIALPMLFSGSVMETLININGLSKEAALAKSMVIPLIVAVFLLLLFVLGKKGRFYPAMPFLTIGCFAGLALMAFI